MSWEWAIARPMLLLHALTGFGALAITIHVLYFAWRGGHPRRAAHRSRARRYVTIAWPMYVAAMITGALVYPAYNVAVRGEYLDANRPEMTGLFEIKEHWGAVGLLLAWGMWRYFRRSAPEELASPDPVFWRGHTLLVLLLVICSAANVIIGAWVTMVRSV
jgi:hypothetical protein